MPEQWCAYVQSLCLTHPEYRDEVTGEWWCVHHAGPLAMGPRKLAALHFRNLRASHRMEEKAS